MGERLDIIPDLRVLPYEADDIQVPAALISLPRDLQFSKTYERGMDYAIFNVLILVGSVDDRIRRDDITKYGDGVGTYSIKKNLESGMYTAFDIIFVASGLFDVMRIAGTDYLGLRFVVNVSGQGSR